MADFRATATVNAADGALFDYLSTVQNLPHYFSRMTSATPGDGAEIHTTAQMSDGTEVEGDAWFRVDQEAQRIEWGSEGPNDHHGSLEVTASSGASEVTVQLHTTRVADGDQTVQDGLHSTVATIKRLVEDRYATT